MKLQGEVAAVDHPHGEIFLKAAIPESAGAEFEDRVYRAMAVRDTQELGLPIEALVLTREKRQALGLPPGEVYFWSGWRTNRVREPGTTVTIEIE